MINGIIKAEGAAFKKLKRYQEDATGLKRSTNGRTKYVKTARAHILPPSYR
ncbi:MAG: hypothetical protein HRT83_00140 [Hyphomicrobiaceae bacterium]|nr:hypothetical protein [Hyphomicrobiaceae bacterium]